MSRGRRIGTWTAAGLLVVGLMASAGIWRYQTTRPEYRLRQGQAALLRDDWESAEAEAIALDRSGFRDHARLIRVQGFARRGRLNEAIVQYNAIRRDQPEILAQASRVLGLGLYFHGQLREAEPLLLHAFQANPNDLDALRGLSALFYDRGAMGQALYYLEKWAALADTDGMPFRFMGLVYESLSGYVPAIENYRKSLDRKLPSTVRPAAAAELAELLVKQTEFAAALACLDENPFEGTIPVTVQVCRAECLVGLGRHSDALAVLDQAARQQPLSARSQRLRGQIHAAKKEDASAVACLELALQIDAHDCPSRYQLALLHARQGRRQQADENLRLLDQSRKLIQEVSDLNQQAAEKPRDAAVRRRLADLCTRLNKPQLAQMWTKAAESCPPADGP